MPRGASLSHAETAARHVTLGEVKAALVDQEGPLWARALPYVIAVAASAALLAGGIGAAGWPVASLCLLLASPLVASFVPTHDRVSREVTLEAGAGFVEVSKAGARAQRIAAASVIGASTAKTPRGVCVTLALERRLAPLSVEVATEAEAEQIRRALGVGHQGVGEVGWTLEHDAATRGPTSGMVVAAALGVVMFLALLLSGVPPEAVLGGVGVYPVIGLILACSGLAKRRSRGRGILMRADGVHVWTGGSLTAIPYARLRDVRIEPSCVVLITDAPALGAVSIARRRRVAFGVGLSEPETEILRAQLLAAAARAHGLGRPKEDVQGRLDVLLRDVHRETARDWLVRLDAVGQALMTSSGYRGGTLEVSDLWAAVEDPEAAGAIRAAAARVLRAAGLPDARVRIEAAASATREPAVQARLRVVLADQDVETAGAALARIEQTEQAEQAEAVRRFMR